MDDGHLPPIVDAATLRAQKKARKKQERKEQKKRDIRLLRRQFVDKEFAKYLRDPQMADKVYLKNLTDQELDEIPMQEFQDKIAQLKQQLSELQDQANLADSPQPSKIKPEERLFSPSSSVKRKLAKQKTEIFKEISPLQKKLQKGLTMKIRKSMAPKGKSTIVKPTKKSNVPKFGGVKKKKIDRSEDPTEGGSAGISYKKLHRLILKQHPTDPDTNEKFQVWENITVNNYMMKMGDALGCVRLYKNYRKVKNAIHHWFFPKAQRKVPKPITMDDVPSSDSNDSEKNDTFKGLSNASIYLGEGAVLYLQTIKTLAILFFILTVINLPVFMMYSEATRNNDYSSINQIFKYFTLGNIARTNKICGYSTLNETGDANPEMFGASDSSFEMTCPTGYIKQIEHLGFLYLLDHTTSTFSMPINQCKEIDPETYDGQEFKWSQASGILFDELAMEPKHQPNSTTHNIDNQCDFENIFKDEEMKNLFTQYFNETCYLKPECNVETDNILVDGKKYEFSQMVSEKCKDRIFEKKISSNYLIVVFGCMSDYIQFPFYPEKLHKEKAGIIIVGVDILSVIITYYVFKRLVTLNNEYLDTMDKNIVQVQRFAVQVNGLQLDKATQDLRLLRMKLWLHFTEVLAPCKTPDNQMEIADINFSYCTSAKYQTIFKLQEFVVELENIDEALASEEITAKDRSSLTKQKKKIKEKKHKYDLRYKEILDNEKKVNKAITNVAVKDFVHGIDYVWITFRNNLTPLEVLKKFEIVHPMTIICRKLLQIEVEKVDEFDDQELQITPTIEPDQIIWKNLKYSMADSGPRKSLVNFAAVIVAFVTMMSTIYFSGQVASLSASIDCNEHDFSLLAAYQRQRQLDVQEQMIHAAQIEEGLTPPLKLSENMICYCKVQTNSGTAPWKATNEFFKEIDPEYEEMPNYCQVYVRSQVDEQAVLNANDYQGVILNSIIAQIFQILGQFMIVHTSIQEKLASFKYIILLEYFNMGIVFLIESFDPSGFTQIILGETAATHKQEFTGFESGWYMVIGLKLCFTIWMSSIITNTKEVKRISQVFVNRFKDRGYKFNIKKDPEDSDDDEVNTKLKSQEDVDMLYLGDEFEGEKSFSRMMSTLLVCLSFSAGMPVLYVVAFVFFGITFFINKVLLFQFYQKTNTLNRVVPQYSLTLLNNAIFIHMVLGCFMFTNESIFQTSKEPDEEMSFHFIDSDTLEKRSNEPGPLQWAYKRFQHIHQQLYLAFFVSSMGLYFGGAALKATLKIIFDLIMSIILYIKKKAIDPIIDCVRNLIKKFIQKFFSKFYEKLTQKGPSIKKQKNTQVGIEVVKQNSDQEEHTDKDKSENENENEQSQSELIKKENPKESSWYEPNSKDSIDIDDRTLSKYGTVDPQFKDSLIVMQKFRQQLTKPYVSENYFMDLNIENLIMMYEKVLWELRDTNKCFNITDEESKDIVLTKPLKGEKKHDLRIIFEEICFVSKTTPEEVIKYLEYLEDRVEQVEIVIEHHFDLIKQVLINGKRDKMIKGYQKLKKQSPDTVFDDEAELAKIEENLRFDEDLSFDDPEIFIYAKKLSDLYDNELGLIVADKQRKENRRGIQTICRIQGSMTQSYFMLDYKDYQVARQIYYNPEEQ